MGKTLQGYKSLEMRVYVSGSIVWGVRASVFKGVETPHMELPS